MTLWSLLLPFKWFIIGVSTVLSGIYNLLKKAVFFIGSLFKFLLEGILTVGQGIAKGFVFIFKNLFLAIKWLGISTGSAFVILFNDIKTLIILLVKLFKIIAIFIYRLFKTIFVLIYKGIKQVFTFIYKTLKAVCVFIYKGLKALALFIYNGIIKIVIFIGKVLKFIGINVVLGVKYFFIYLYKALFFILKYIFISIKFVSIYLYKIIVFILKYLVKFISFVFKYLYIAIKFILVNILFAVLVVIFKFIIKIPIFIAHFFRFIGLGLYKILIYPFVYLFKNFSTVIKNGYNKVKDKINAFFKFIINIPKNIKNATVNWFNNLSFVKDIRNRREMKRQALLIDFDDEDAVRSEKKILYRYKAKNADGKYEKGTLGAYSKLDVHSYLLSEGYEVYEIEPLKGMNLSLHVNHKIKMSDLVFFLAQLSTYIKSGIPLVESIKILGKQTKNSGTKSVYKALVYDLTMGASFSEALEKQGSSFPKLLVNMIKSSELAGNLSETLDDMSEYYSSISKTRKEMKSAMTYPAVILTFATGVVVFILVFVIPSFVKMYASADAEVPAITTIVINSSEFLSNNYIWLILGLVGIITLLYFMYKNVKVFRMIVQWLMMHTPILGKIIINNEVAIFSKTFASLWSHNVFITNSMEILSKITNNEIYKMLIFDAITNVARGESVSTSFKNQWAFPVIAYEMLVTGERTGQPGPMMDKVADYFQEEHKNSINQVKAFIEPVLIIFLAVVVGVILLAVVIPMFSIYGQLGA